MRAATMSEETKFHCVGCGYDLAGLADWSADPTVPCPECGQHNTLPRILDERRHAYRILDGVVFETWLAPLAIQGVAGMLVLALTIDYALASPLLSEEDRTWIEARAGWGLLALGAAAVMLSAWHAARHTRMIRRAHWALHGAEARSPYVRAHWAMLPLRILVGIGLGSLGGLVVCMAEYRHPVFMLLPCLALGLGPVLLLMVPALLGTMRSSTITRRARPEPAEFDRLADDPAPAPAWPEADGSDEGSPAPEPEPGPEPAALADAVTEARDETAAEEPPPAADEPAFELAAAPAAVAAAVPAPTAKAEALARKRRAQISHPWWRLLTHGSLIGIITMLAMPLLAVPLGSILLNQLPADFRSQASADAMALIACATTALAAMGVALVWGLCEGSDLVRLRRGRADGGPWRRLPIPCTIGWGLLAALLVAVQLLTWLPMTLVAVGWLWRWIARKPFAKAPTMGLTQGH